MNRPDIKKNYDRHVKELELANQRRVELPKALQKVREDLPRAKEAFINALYDFYILENESSWEEVEILQKKLDQSRILIDNKLALEAKLEAEVNSLRNTVKQLKPYIATTPEVPQKPHHYDTFDKRMEEMAVATKENFRMRARALRIAATDSIVQKGWVAEEAIGKRAKELGV